MSESSESNKEEDNQDSADDPIVEIPRISGNELIKKSQISSMDIRGMVVRCTACLHQINHHDEDKCRKHYRLNVIVCKECHDFYGTSEFSQDESGNYNYCTWCGNGGKLYLCDFCPHAFCSTCVRRNFGRAEVSKMSKEGWKCYMCNPDQLKSKVAYCELIINYSKAAKLKKEKKAITSDLLINKISGPLEWVETKDWVLPSFDDIDDSCKSLHKKLEKLKVVGSSQTKSLRHLIKKMEEIVNNHKSELGVIMKTLSTRYVKYLEKIQKTDKLKNEMNDVKNKNSKAKLNGNATEKHDMIDITSENEKDTSPDDVKINETEYKAKLSLLEDDASKSSNSDSDWNLENLKSETKYIVKENNKEESKLKDEYMETDDNEEESKLKDEPMETKDNKEKSKLKDEPMETEDNEGQSAELFVAETPVEDTKESHKKLSDDSDAEHKTVVDPVVSSKAVKKKAPNAFRRKLDFLDSEAVASNSSMSDSEKSSDAEKKKIRRKLTPKKHRSAIKSKVKLPIVVNKDDPKLKTEIRVVLERCDNLLPDGETTIPVPEEDSIEELDKEISSLCRSIKIKESDRERKTTAKEKKTASKSFAGPKSRKPVKNSGSSSSSICLSSSEDDEKKSETKSKLIKAKGKEDTNDLAKKDLLADDSGESSETSDNSGSEEEEEVIKKKSKKGAKPKSDSSDDFQPRKKKKFDKLLNKRLLSDDDSSNDKEKNKEKQAERKKSTKRKHVSSDNDSKDKKEKNSDETSSSDSDEEKDKKKKRRKRIKKAAVSSSENESDKDKEKTASQNTPGKGRKNIKKILSKKDLATETKEAQNAERERKKRVMERQKSYNIITDTSTDGKEVITRKMVLEVDSTSKEEIVEIHPELCEKLKPHQVKGVRFMWECTIESIKELGKGPGSGCILAHCMGLGKTLQVITFLHTCLTNEHVNKKIKTALVICPYNTVLNWSREFEHWLEKIDGEVLVHELTAAKDNYMRLDILKYWKRDGGVLISSYDIFRRLALDKKLAKLSKKHRDLIRELLVDPGPDIVVCDEGHILKNVNSAISKACSQLATERRIVLTGTPLQNNLQEYHCMLSFVKPHLLGTAKEFRNRFVNPIINGQYDDSNDYDVKRMKKRIHILHKLLDGCVQRCDYAALTKFLPPKHEFVIGVKLSEVQIKMYQHYLDNLSRHKNQVKIQGGTLFQDYNILRNLCTHPYIVHTSFERAEERRILNADSEEEDFINDESEETAKSGSGSGSESPEEEVIKTYKTRSRKTENESDIEEEVDAPKEKRWYDEYISEEDQFRLDLSGKMVLLIDILKECEAIGDKVILFSQSLLTLDIVEDILSEINREEVSEEDKKRDILCRWAKNIDYFRMDGTTSAEFRKRYIDMFNNPANDRARLFLVSTKAGGLGTNLVGANRVVMLDASWNPSHDVQAIFRVYRFGQKKPVYIYRLLAQGTMEEKIYDRQVTKLSLSIRVVDEQQIDRHFNAAELAELYNFNPESLSNRPTPLVPKDTLLAEMLIKHSNWIVTYHEHDSLLQNQTEEDLTEEERQAAWNEYENEREGRSYEEDSIGGDEIGEYSKEPDFAQADYVGNMIPTSKVIIESVIANLKKKFPTSNAVDLRQKLLLSIYTLINIFQQKHVKILRMKQEYVARGSVPVAINKYLDELSKALTDLNTHYENIKMMVQKDHNDKVAARLAQMQQQQQQQQQQQRFMPTPATLHFPQQHRPTFSARPQQYPGMTNMKGAAGNFPNFAQMRQSAQSKLQQFPGGINPGLSNFRAGAPRWTTAGNINNPGRQYSYVPPPNKNATPVNAQPVITEVEVDTEDTNVPEYTNDAKSSVVIEEVID